MAAKPSLWNPGYLTQSQYAAIYETVPPHTNYTYVIKGPSNYHYAFTNPYAYLKVKMEHCEPAEPAKPIMPERLT